MDISAEFADVARIGPFFEVDTAPSGPGWIPMSEGLEVRIGTTRDALRDWYGVTDLRVAASLTQLNVVSRVLSPVLALAVRHGVVPVLSLGDLRWQPSSSAASLGLVAPRGAPATVTAIDGSVLATVVEPLVTAIAATGRISRQILWGNVGSALGGAVTVLARTDPAQGRRARALVEQLLTRTPRAGTGSYVDGRFRRRSCCLYYRVDPAAGYCGDCILTS